MTGTPLLSVAGLTAHYGDFQALFGVDMQLDAGGCVAIIGANGAGKTTLMRTIASRGASGVHPSLRYARLLHAGRCDQ